MSNNKELKKRKRQQETFVNQLGKGNRVTNTRLDIIECLSDGFHQHTASDIVNHLKKKNSNLNIGTVYNNLKVLLSQGIIDACPNYQSQNQRYELVDTTNFHIHIRDFKSNKEEYENVPDGIVDQIKNLLSKKGYDIHNLKIEVLVKEKKENN